MQPDEICRRILGGRFQIPFGSWAPLRVPSASVHEQGRHQSDLEAANDGPPHLGGQTFERYVLPRTQCTLTALGYHSNVGTPVPCWGALLSITWSGTLLGAPRLRDW